MTIVNQQTSINGDKELQPATNNNQQTTSKTQ